MSGPMEPMRSGYNPQLDPFRRMFGGGQRVSQTQAPMRKDQSRVQSDYNAPRDRPQPPRARQTTSGTPSGFRMPGEVSQYSQQPSDQAYPQGRPSPSPPSPQGAMTPQAQPTPVSFMLQALEQNMKGAGVPLAWQGLGASRWSGYDENAGDYMPPMPHPNYPIMPAPVDMPQNYEWSNEAPTGDSFLLQGQPKE